MKEHIIAKYAESTIYGRELLTRLYDYLYSLVGDEKIEIYYNLNLIGKGINNGLERSK